MCWKLQRKAGLVELAFVRKNTSTVAFHTSEVLRMLAHGDELHACSQRMSIIVSDFKDVHKTFCFIVEKFFSFLLQSVSAQFHAQPSLWMQLVRWPIPKNELQRKIVTMIAMFPSFKKMLI